MASCIGHRGAGTVAGGAGCGADHAYGRGDAFAYLTAYDVHAAKLFGRIEERTGIVPFMNPVAHVMNQEPCASAKRVFWVVDNRSSRSGQKAAGWLTAAFPNTAMAPRTAPTIKRPST
ncbi:hypothetical protein ACF065_33430 [Streptomyces sp. NPDC015232]|uniref:hypothetical protein n=1 Tax=unclassified Streptomyces TaxID=2593676 RepID=UPI0036F5B2DC